jgi:hypothetical protein
MWSEHDQQPGHILHHHVWTGAHRLMNESTIARVHGLLSTLPYGMSETAVEYFSTYLRFCSSGICVCRCTQAVLLHLSRNTVDINCWCMLW